MEINGWYLVTIVRADSLNSSLTYINQRLTILVAELLTSVILAFGLVLGMEYFRHKQVAKLSEKNDSYSKKIRLLLDKSKFSIFDFDTQSRVLTFQNVIKDINTDPYNGKTVEEVADMGIIDSSCLKEFKDFFDKLNTYDKETESLVQTTTGKWLQFTLYQVSKNNKK